MSVTRLCFISMPGCTKAGECPVWIMAFSGELKSLTECSFSASVMFSFEQMDCSFSVYSPAVFNVSDLTCLRNLEKGMSLISNS